MVGMGGALLALQIAIRCSQSVISYENERKKREADASSGSIRSESYFTPTFTARVEPTGASGLYPVYNCTNIPVCHNYSNIGSMQFYNSVTIV